MTLSTEDFSKFLSILDDDGVVLSPEDSFSSLLEAGDGWVILTTDDPLVALLPNEGHEMSFLSDVSSTCCKTFGSICSLSECEPESKSESQKSISSIFTTVRI